MSIHRDGALSRRLRALKVRLEPEDDTGAPSRIDLPPIALPRDERPTREQEFDGVPDGYILFIVLAPEPRPLDRETGLQPPQETWTWLRMAFRQGGRHSG
jgi:hypothetical protein